MTMDRRIANLAAVAASIGANCQSCLEINVARAVKSGVGPEEIADAVEIGRNVRAGAASRMDAFASGLSIQVASAPLAEAKCGCG